MESLQCILDSPGRDAGGDLNCTAPRLANIQVVLVSRLDIEAEKWVDPGAFLRGTVYPELHIIKPQKP